MNKSVKKTVTIGIYAHNTAPDIIYLLRSILKQKGNNFTIDEIIVISDGSVDLTAKKVSDYAEKYPIIRLITYKEHAGRSVRIQQLFNLVKSDYIFCFNGDVIVTKTNSFEKMISAFDKKSTMLISVNLQPMSVKGLKAGFIKSWYLMVGRTTKLVNKGDNIYNFLGTAFGVSTTFAKDIVFPNAVSSECAYMYLIVKEQKKNFAFISDVIVLFHTPAQFKDYFNNTQRWYAEKKALLMIFGKGIRNEFKIPFNLAVPSFTLSILKNPFNILVIIFFGIFSFAPIKIVSKMDNQTQITASTKRKAHSY